MFNLNKNHKKEKSKLITLTLRLMNSSNNTKNNGENSIINAWMLDDDKISPLVPEKTKNSSKPALRKFSDQFDGLIYEKKNPLTNKIQDFIPEKPLFDNNNISNQLNETSQFQSNIIVSEERKSDLEISKNIRSKTKKDFQYYMDGRKTEISYDVRIKKKPKSVKNQIKDETPLQYKGEHYFDDSAWLEEPVSSIRVDQRELIGNVQNVFETQENAFKKITEKFKEQLTELHHKVDDVNAKVQEGAELMRQGVNNNSTNDKLMWFALGVFSCCIVGGFIFKWFFKSETNTKSEINPKFEINLNGNLLPNPNEFPKINTNPEHFNLAKNLSPDENKFMYGYCCGMFSFSTMVLGASFMKKIIK